MLKRALILMSVVFTGFAGVPAFAQDGQVTGDQDGSSQQVEESDEAYRRRMELEDARRRDPTYTDPSVDYRREREKIDGLPQESRDNIREQLIDVIVQNPDWQPEDALEEYPYEPTAAAQADPELEQQEQEAWDEQIEKYHAREAAAFGAYRGKAGGPGNPDGSEDGSDGGQSGQAGGQQGGQPGQQGSQGSESEKTKSGTYQPYSASSENAEDAVSTEGVSESALEFLMNRQAGGTSAQSTPPPPAPSAQASPQGGAQSESEPSTAQASQQAQAQETAEASQSEMASEADESENPLEPDMRGIIAIEDLDKLEGTGSGSVRVISPDEEPEQETPDGDP